MRGSDREKYLRIRNLTYRVSQGWSTGRHSSFTRAHEGAHGGWRCIALTSAEKSIRDMAADAKVERQQGEVLRLIDVPAVFPGSDHVFDRRSADVPIPNFKAWRDTTFAGIVADCEADHGAPLRKYVEKMSGLVYAGGLLGIRLGIVPWQQDELLDAIAKCYRGARSLLPDEGVALRQGLAILQTRLSSLARAKLLKRHASTDWDKLDGYWRRKSGQDRYVIKREVFNALFATATQKNLVLKHLMENGQIAMAVRKSGGASSERKPRGQFYWPDGERRRSYEITFPRD
jgi:hypothetical protein